MDVDETHDASRRSWVESTEDATTDFPIQNLPFCMFRHGGGPPRGGVGIGDQIVDLAAVVQAGLLSGSAAEAAGAACGSTLNALMALGSGHRAALRAALFDLLSDGHPGAAARVVRQKILVPMADAQLELPAFIRAFSDFTSSAAHTNRLRGSIPEVLYRLPVAYNGRASSIRLDGTPVRRPLGQFRTDNGTIDYGAEPRLDFELELGAFVGMHNPLGMPVPVSAAHDHIFGFVLVNDWSARGIQLLENMLGPFLGKSFQTTISPWVVTPEALAPFRVAAVVRTDEDMRAPAHLLDDVDQSSGGLNLELTAEIRTERMRLEGTAEKIVTTNFREMIWTFAQMLAHHTSNGCNLETGDVIASGTLSGSAENARACFAEINEKGKTSLYLKNGETRTWLEDGDEMIFRARASREGFASIGFGTCSGCIMPAAAP